ncbi:phosphomannomutase/phosphoglucomutase [Halioglobus maricola]|uniref:phosphomannomutase n=1 Tax=Halioglobus maricola TaxID=2601894 RepID=A0A5P9NRI5_9GAMM|nr:phosphomannomutase/phosphoglucomutase [Halioglobus maricola]QFU77628.1 phosphomannomutase/phosphoglucomutase [Halioglobus maricola]
MLKLTKKNKDASGGKSRPKTAGKSQGISSPGNALYKILITALGALALVLVVAFTYLLLLREPALSHNQIERAADSYASQQATNLHRMITLLRSRMVAAANTPLAQTAIASQSREELQAVETALLEHFPELISLRILPVGEMGTAAFKGGNQGLRNHIEVNMVGRTSDGEATRPESYQIEGQWLTSLAQLVKNPDIENRNAVILATLANDSINRLLEGLDGSVGNFAVEQAYTSPTGLAKTNIIASTGNGGDEAYTRYAAIPDTTWTIAFTPSEALLQALTPSSMPTLAVFILCMLGAVGAFALVAIRMSRVLENDVNQMISAADRKSELQLATPQLVPAARQLRRATLRAIRAGNAAAESVPEEDTQTLDLESETGSLELDLASDAPDVPDDFPAHIFRAYDIRGDARSELNEELIAQIGLAIGTIAGEMNEQSLLVGCDGRKSSPALKAVLIRALMESGRDVIDIGLVPTPVLYFATHHLECRSGIMVTGSHNPKTDNGLKIVLNRQTIAAGGIEQIRDRVLAGDFSHGSGRMIKEDVVPAYVEEIAHDVAVAVPLKIVLDAGNGATSAIAPELFEELGCEVVPLYCSVDGDFPNHAPDTSDEANLTDLIEAVKEENADFGVAFDGDGDRLAVVTSSGRIVRSDILLMVFAEDVVSRNPGADVVFDVKCSRNLTQLITQHGGRPVLWKTGHAFMKEKMAETGALLGGEFSGHMFFGERWFGFDDGMYAAGRLAEILGTHGSTLDELIDRFPATVNTPEILIPVDDRGKHAIVERIVAGAEFSGGRVNTMDGLRVDFAEGWGLVRASNTTAALTARFEAESEEALENIKNEFREQISVTAPSLDLNF